MSIYATLWTLQFPEEGDDYPGCAWTQVIVQGVPAHVGADQEPDPYRSFLPPRDKTGDLYGELYRAVVVVTAHTRKGTERAGQEYVDPLLILSGREYACETFESMCERITGALRGDGPRLVMRNWTRDGRLQLFYEHQDGELEKRVLPAPREDH